MKKLLSTTIALSILLMASSCSTNSQIAQQKQACTAGDPHPWCMQLGADQAAGILGFELPD
jgi:hypothetical protein